MLALDAARRAPTAPRCWSATAPSWRSRSGSASPSWSRRRAAARSACACSRTSASAVTYTSDLTPAGLERLARDSVELAALAEPDPSAALPAREEMARERPRPRSVGRGGAVARRRRGDPARARGRGGGAGARQARHQLRRRGVRAHRRRVGVRDVGRVFGIGARHARVVRGRADLRRRRRQEAQRLVLDAPAASPAALARSRRRSGVEAARRTVAKLGARKIPTGAAPVVFSPDAARALLGPARGRDVGRRGLAQVELPRRPRGDGGRVAARRDRRRSAAAARPGLAPVRRRGAAEPHQRAGLRGRAAHASCATSTRRASSGGGRPARRRAAIGGSPHVGISNLILRAGPHARRRARDASSAASTSPT